MAWPVSRPLDSTTLVDEAAMTQGPFSVHVGEDTLRVFARYPMLILWRSAAGGSFAGSYHLSARLFFSASAP
jgi:hypothetical protein